MAKTLLIMATHFIDENVISEYRKMKNTPNVDAVLAIDNTNLKIEFTDRIESRIFFDTSCKCFFFDSVIDDELLLPYFREGDKKRFEKTTWHNGDYRFYYVRKFFPAYDFYWMIEYDVFCNAENYAGFLEKFVDNRADLLIQALDAGTKNKHEFIKDIDWVYPEEKNLYIGLFSVVRLSARAIDFLYQKRLEHKEKFFNSGVKDKQWVFCEIFVPTELVNGDFNCKDLNEPTVRFLPYLYLNDERIFLRPDDHLYHPVKSVRAEIEKIKTKYADLFLAFRKNFFIQLIENLDSISKLNFKNLPIHFYDNYGGMAIDLLKNDLRLESWFVHEIRYGTINKINVAVVFYGEYMKDFERVTKCIDFKQMSSLQTLESPTCKMLSYETETFDNVFQVANVTNVLLEMTFTILKEKL